MNVSPGSPFMHVLRLSSLRPAEVGLKLKHRTGAQAHRMLCLTLGCVGCQFGTPNEPDPHKIDGLPSLAGSWINLSLSLSCFFQTNKRDPASRAPSHGLFLVAGAAAGTRSIPWILQCLSAVGHPSPRPARSFLLARTRSGRFPLPFSAPHVQHLRPPRSNVL